MRFVVYFCVKWFFIVEFLGLRLYCIFLYLLFEVEEFVVIWYIFCNVIVLKFIEFDLVFIYYCIFLIWLIMIYFDLGGVFLNCFRRLFEYIGLWIGWKFLCCIFRKSYGNCCWNDGLIELWLWFFLRGKLRWVWLWWNDSWGFISNILIF